MEIKMLDKEEINTNCKLRLILVSMKLNFMVWLTELTWRHNKITSEQANI